MLNANVNNHFKTFTDAILRVLGRLTDVEVNFIEFGCHQGFEFSGFYPSGAQLFDRFKLIQGGNVVYLRTVNRHATGPNAVEKVSESDLRFDPTTGVWFPARVVYRHKIGGEVRIERDLVVEEAVFNTPVAARVFTLAGFGLADGTPVGSPGGGHRANTPTWQNGHVDPNATMGAQTLAAERARLAETLDEVEIRPAPTQWKLAVASTLLVAAGLWLSMKALRRRA